MKKSLLLIGCLLGLSRISYAALASTCTWEVRTTATSQGNAGCFDSSLGGTDYSMQASSQLSVTDLTEVSASSTVVSITGGFTSAMVGNCLHVNSGTNFTVGFYEIVGFTDTNTILLDRNAASGAGSLGVISVGGALPIIATATVQAVAGNHVYVKSGTYQPLATATIAAGSIGNEIVVEGYNTTRGDLNNVYNFANFPTILANNVNLTGFTMTNNYSVLKNFIMDAGSGGTKGSKLITVSGGNGNSVINCKAVGALTAGGFVETTNTFFDRCVATGNATGGFVLSGTGSYLKDCVAKACTGTGFANSGGVTITYDHCLSYNNTGASSDGFSRAGVSGDIYTHCVAYNNGRSGFRFSSASSGVDNTRLMNCITAKNAAFGVDSVNSSWNERPFDYNAYFSNTSGTSNNIPVGSHDVILSADPFNNAAGDDFSLNSNANGGARLRFQGFPGTLPLGLTTGFEDIGVVQNKSESSASFVQ